jgi:hypothetical protein
MRILLLVLVVRVCLSSIHLEQLQQVKTMQMFTFFENTNKQTNKQTNRQSDV